MASLFSHSRGHPPVTSLTRETLEQLVTRVDPRLKMLPNYQHRLLSATESLVQHIADLLAALPGVTDVRIQHYASHPELALFFSSPERLAGVIKGSSAMRDWVKAQSQLPDCYCLLVLRAQQRQRLGSAMKNGILRRDVKLPYLDFSGYRLLGLSTDLGLLLDKLQQRALDEYCNLALQTLTKPESDRLALEREQDLLKSQLFLRQSGHKGFEAELTATDQTPKLTTEQLTQRLDIISQELANLHTETTSLEDKLKQLDQFLHHPKDVVSWGWVEHQVDSQGILQKADSPEGHTVGWLQLTLQRGEPFVLCPLMIPADELQALGF